MAGLSTALRLSEKGYKVEVFEAMPFVGGLAASFKFKGFFFDFGPHNFHAGKKQNEKIVKKTLKIMNGKIHQTSMKAAVVFRGQLFNYPLKIRDILKNLPLHYALFCVLDFSKARLFDKIADYKNVKSFEEYVIKKYGKSLYKEYFLPYTFKVWGIEPKNLTAKFAKERIPITSIRDVLFKEITGKKISPFEQNHPHSPYHSTGYYPKEGYGQIAKRFAVLVEKNGGKIYLETMVKKITINGNKATALYSEKDGKIKKIKTDFVVSTIPLPNLIGIIEPALEKNILRIKEKLEYSSLVLLYLIIKKPFFSDNIWIYFPDKDVTFSRISENKNAGANTRFAGKTGICIEFPCYENDKFWKADKTQLFELAIKDLKRLGLLKREDVLDMTVKKIPKAYCVYKHGIEENLEALKTFFSGFENLSLIGRTAEFRYVNIDQLIKDGFLEADKIDEKLKKGRQAQ